MINQIFGHVEDGSKSVGLSHSKIIYLLRIKSMKDIKNSYILKCFPNIENLCPKNDLSASWRLSLMSSNGYYCKFQLEFLNLPSAILKSSTKIF